MFFSLDLLATHGVRGSGVGPNHVRFVTHLDVDDGDIDSAVVAVRAIMGQN